MNWLMWRGGTTAQLTEICKLVFYSSLKGVSRWGGGEGLGKGMWREGGVQGLVDGFDWACDFLFFFKMSRTMCSWNPLGKPIVRGSVLVVRGCGGMRGTSWVVRVLWCRPRGGTIILMAVVCTTSVPVIVGTTVIPLTTCVITLSVEGTPVSLENLRGRV